MKTQVGFNRFRYLYHCPHRRLVNILNDICVIEPNNIMPMTITAQYYLFGQYVLTYELNCSYLKTILLNFHIDIVTFESAKAILSQELLPMDIEEHRRVAQAVWIRNITLQNIKFVFNSKNRNFRLLNPCIIVPRQSVWPLIVEYRPSEYDNKVK